MAQRYCTNCGNGLGSNDAFCAGCGRPAHQTAAVATPEADVDVPPHGAQEISEKTFLQKWWPFIALLVLFALIIVNPPSGNGGDTNQGGGGSQGSSGAAKPEDSKAQAVKPESVEDDGSLNNIPGKMDEVVDVGGGSTVEISEARRVEELRISFMDEILQGPFVVVEFTYTYGGDQPVTIGEAPTSLEDGEGKQYFPDFENSSDYSIDRDFGSVNGTTVNPSVPTRRAVVFSVPPDAKDFEVLTANLYKPRAHGWKTATVPLPF